MLLALGAFENKSAGPAANFSAVESYVLLDLTRVKRSRALIIETSNMNGLLGFSDVGQDRSKLHRNLRSEPTPETLAGHPFEEWTSAFLQEGA